MPIFGSGAQFPVERKRLLSLTGPVINVKVRNPISPSSENELDFSAFDKTLKGRALIDTGASMNCIDTHMAERAGLMIVDEQIVAPTSSRQKTPVYYGKIHIPVLDDIVRGQFFGVRLIYNGQENHFLLGRPFLSNYVFNYDGPQGLFSLDKAIHSA